MVSGCSGAAAGVLHRSCTSSTIRRRGGACPPHAPPAAPYVQGHITTTGAALPPPAPLPPQPAARRATDGLRTGRSDPHYRVVPSRLGLTVRAAARRLGECRTRYVISSKTKQVASNSSILFTPHPVNFGYFAENRSSESQKHPVGHVIPLVTKSPAAGRTQLKRNGKRKFAALGRSDQKEITLPPKKDTHFHHKRRMHFNTIGNANNDLSRRYQRIEAHPLRDRSMK